jgi:predicted RNA-binding Zn-ribbon protein involved in translation (DUF1610 family)
MKQKIMIISLLVFVVVATSAIAASSQKSYRHGQRQAATKTETPAVEETTKSTVIYRCPMHPEVTSNEPGKCSKCGMELQKEENKVVYQCPRHPDVITDKPGKCPKCKKELQKTMTPERFQGGKDT